MKAILMSVHAKWCALMMNGDKTVEVRKGTALYKTIQKLIDENGYADIYVYCTKKEELFYDLVCGKRFYFNLPKRNKNKVYRLSNGMVVFKFRCYNVETIIYDNSYFKPFCHTRELTSQNLYDKSCLSYNEIDNYLNGNTGCAIHISDLEIFDKPKAIWEFEKVGRYKNPTIKCEKREKGRCNYGHSPFTGKWVGCEKARLTKAPQSWQFIEVEE